MLDRGNHQHNSRCAATDDLAPCRPPKRKDFQAPHKTRSRVKAGRKGPAYLNVEIYGHGNPFGPVYDGEGAVGVGGKIDARAAIEYMRDLGDLLRGAMGDNGHILAGWCQSCSVGTGANAVLGALAGHSGHEVIGVIDDVEYAPPSDPTWAFSEPHPELEDGKRYWLEAMNEHGATEIVYFASEAEARQYGRQNEKRVTSQAPNRASGWMSFSPTFTSPRGIVVANDGDTEQRGKPVVRGPLQHDVLPYSMAELGIDPDVAPPNGADPHSRKDGSSGRALDAFRSRPRPPAVAPGVDKRESPAQVATGVIAKYAGCEDY